MSIPVNARIRAVPHFLARLNAARQFMQEPDADSAPARFRALQNEVARARAVLSFAPASGRPARLLNARSGWGRFQAQQAVQLAAALGMPELREFLPARHVLLYAHSDREVVLLSIRHERERGYGIGP